MSREADMTIRSESEDMEKAVGEVNLGDRIRPLSVDEVCRGHRGGKEGK